MALYLGNNKVKLNVDGVLYYLNLFSETPIFGGIRLLSSDGYILKDSNELYLVVKE